MKYNFKNVSAWYTGGNIYVMFGKLVNGAWFMTGDDFYDDEGSPYILLLDRDAEIHANDDNGSFYYEWQEEHKVGELIGNNGISFWNQMIQYLKENTNTDLTDRLVTSIPLSCIEERLGAVKVSIEILATYDIGEGFLIDIVDNDAEGEYEAWIYHKWYGYKKHMFSVTKSEDDLESFVQDVLYDRYEYMSMYKEEDWFNEEV